VAIDDVWALIIFGFSLSFAKAFIHGDGTLLNVGVDLLIALLEIVGAFLIGGAIAFLFKKLSHFINTVKERLIYTFGFLLLTIGLADACHFSILLSCMFLGAVLTNISKESFQFFDSLREIDTPLYLIFFVLAGASLKIDVLGVSAFLAIGFIIFRTIGKVIGASLGAKIAGIPNSVGKLMGPALIPQAGVALACALVAKNTIGGIWGDKILVVTIASTVFFELIGPWATKHSLIKVGNIQE